MEFYRKKKDDQVLVTIVDNPSRLSEAEWDRVVAVFVLGAPWQFSGWRISEPAVLFSKGENLFSCFYISTFLIVATLQCAATF